MSKTISVPRGLLERVCHTDNSTRQLARRELRALLSAPAVEGELEAIGNISVTFDEGDEGSAIELVDMYCLMDEGVTELCSLPKAQSVIDQYRQDALRYRWMVKNATYGIDYRQRPEMTLPIYAPDRRSELSAAIDKAMKGEGDE